ncbi:hypothetical protein NQ317_006427, partial [Molorchus minor]
MAQGKTKKPFVSCIKVKGIDLLPPVITEKRRSELQQYKQQAIKLEKRLNSCRELKRNLEELLNFQPLADQSLPETSCSDDRQVEVLKLTQNDITCTSRANALRRGLKINLTKDIIDVTEYSNNGIKMIQTDSEECIEANTQNTWNHSVSVEPNNEPVEQVLNKKDLQFTILGDNKNISQTIVKDTLQNISPEKSRPRLIRSNSYILDSPSPILLAHLEKTNKNNSQANNEFPQLLQSRNWSSLENNYVPFENSEFSSINTVYNNDKINNKNDVTCNTPNPPDQINHGKDTPVIEVIQTDISVQQITVNANDVDKSHLAEEIQSNTSDLTDSNTQLLRILKTIPEAYSKQIIEVIQNQRHRPCQDKGLNSPTIESTTYTTNQYPIQVNSIKNIPVTQLFTNGNERLKSVNNLSPNENIFHVFSNTKENYPSESEHGIHQSTSHSESLISMSPSQSIHYSISSDTLQTPSSHSDKLLDSEEFDYSKTLNKINESEKSNNFMELYIQDEVRSNINVSRELFPYMDASTMQTIKQEWAASIIGAHVKGYLTRRLLRTERVQTLIETIKDALVCALQIHNVENIDEADVELHRRLINQIRQRKSEKQNDHLQHLESKDQNLYLSSTFLQKQRLQPLSQSLTK